MCSIQRFVFEIQYWISYHIIEMIKLIYTSNLINPYLP